MRDIFEGIFVTDPPNPMEAARKNMRPPLRKRFYRAATAEQTPAGDFAVLLDGRSVRTPAAKQLTAPAQPLAAALAAEWDAQREVINPARMPLTRLANTIIDGVSENSVEVVDEVHKYLASDLLFYRAEQPEGLVSQQARHWDPVLTWAHEALGARFMLSEGVMFVGQPKSAIAAAAAAISTDPWRLGAVHAITTLTGSALLALAVLRRRLSAQEAWTAANVDEDWNMAQWGSDDLALERRAFRWTEMQAAATVLELLPEAEPG